jgi:PKD repeat protein
LGYISNGARVSSRASLAIAGLAGLLAALLILLPSPAQSAPGDVGYEGASFSGTGTPTGTKRAESVLWWNDGSWWANMWDTASQDFHIFRLNVTTQTWQDTEVTTDTRANTHADVRWDGTRLYISSHEFVSDEQSATSGSPSYLYRFSYNSATDTYTLDTGFPVQINNMRTETLVIDKDSTGKIWATWQQGNQIYLNRTLNGDDRQWGTPFVFPNAAANVTVDDNAALIAFGGNKMGLMWSNQGGSNYAMWFAFHQDGASDTTWSAPEKALQGPSDADDHINLKSLQADASGRVFAATKTSNSSASTALVMLSVRNTNGAWSRHPVALVSDCPNRPLLLIDEQNNVIHMFYTAPGPPNYSCTSSGGAIYTKTSPLNSVSFTNGRGTPVIVDADSPFVHDVSSTKQNLNGTTELVVLAINGSTRRYWHHYQALPGGSSATPSPTLTPSPAPPSGTPGTITLNPVDDAYVAGDNVTANFGQDMNLVSDASPLRESYLKFDLQPLAGRTVQSAALRMWVTSGSSGVENIKAVSDTTWTENSINFNSKPAKGATITTFAPGTGTLRWHEVDLTSAVSSAAGSLMSLAMDSTSSDGYDFNSAEATSNRVELVVQWSGGATTTPTSSATPTRTPTPAASSTPTPVPTPTPTPVPPVADFSGSPSSGIAPLSVNFTDTSAGAPTSWAWSFGDGGTSPAQNPSHVYTAAGTYSVTLQATNAGGSNTLTKTNYITVLPPPPDFTITLSPAKQTINVGGNTTYTTTATPANGFSGQVTLSVSGLPSGTTASFSPNPVNASSPASSTLFIQTSSSTPRGNYTLTITATSGSLTHTTTTQLQVKR